jgi:hypothetical protein
MIRVGVQVLSDSPTAVQPLLSVPVTIAYRYMVRFLTVSIWVRTDVI